LLDWGARSMLNAQLFAEVNEVRTEVDNHDAGRKFRKVARKVLFKRFVAGLAASVACLAASGAAASAAGPTQDQVDGNVKGVFPTQFGPFASQVHVNAKGNAIDAQGNTWGNFFDTPVGDVVVRASVYCVDVEGNQAIVGSIVERSNTAFVPVGSVTFRKVIDNGEGRNDPPDQTGTTSFFPAPPRCPPATTPIATAPVDEGNFVVINARDTRND